MLGLSPSLPSRTTPGHCSPLSGPPHAPRMEGSSLAFWGHPHLGRPSGWSVSRVARSLALQLAGTHKRLRTTAPAKATSRKKGREPKMDVMTIMPPLLRPGHVSIAEYGVTEGTQACLPPQTLHPQPSPGNIRRPTPPWQPQISGRSGDPGQNLSPPRSAVQLPCLPHTLLPTPSSPPLLTVFLDNFKL